MILSTFSVDLLAVVEEELKDDAITAHLDVNDLVCINGAILLLLVFHGHDPTKVLAKVFHLTHDESLLLDKSLHNFFLLVDDLDCDQLQW